MSEYYNPTRESFKQAKRIEAITLYLLIASAALTFTNYILTNFFKDLEVYAGIASNINTVIILLYAILKFGVNYIIFHNSFNKRADFIDNSFDTNYSPTRSNKYYNNDTIAPGILRMGANSFESCFFTYKLSLKSILSKWILNLSMIILIISVALQGSSTAFSMLIQLSLPIFLISDAINHSVFCLRIKNIFDSFCRLYNDLIDEKNIEKKEPEIILLVLNYETTKSTFNLLVSEKIYNKFNPQLSEDWEKLKEQYKLNLVPEN